MSNQLKGLSEQSARLLTQGLLALLAEKVLSEEDKDIVMGLLGELRAIRKQLEGDQ